MFSQFGWAGHRPGDDRWLDRRPEDRHVLQEGKPPEVTAKEAACSQNALYHHNHRKLNGKVCFPATGKTNKPDENNLIKLKQSVAYVQLMLYDTTAWPVGSRVMTTLGKESILNKNIL